MIYIIISTNCSNKEKKKEVIHIDAACLIIYISPILRKEVDIILYKIKNTKYYVSKESVDNWSISYLLQYRIKEDIIIFLSSITYLLPS